MMSDEKVQSKVSGRKAGAADEVQLPGWNLDELNYPTFRMTLIAKIMDRLTIRNLAEIEDITYAEWRVMARLATMHQGGTVRQVAEMAWVDRAEVSRAVSTLEEKGYTLRMENPHDRRAPILKMTSVGLERYRAALAERKAFHELLTAKLSDKECETLNQLLAKIGEQLVVLSQPVSTDAVK
ncbi:MULTISPECIES: MarR family winged helix-turn-helix transcriptional regulator [unclassified Sphingobium]|uniref:MarR family winged helix-turn-helix transcriptional regulator n=1 Tax=unclassified Sphingobium TaxID=2611147 RepID=UPI0022250B13|nr:MULTISPECIES: MarR family winged helix-turn-helix transcriptional regulator [unclassified Sphingobium]MCW2382944.1 DNA-binding MarR family transcriptional regulator [Sphingobium sp. B2D3B]MCW2400080.1 DNA-binding MarR family transcriptional regulator [Sphingobium sp. B2D3C]